MNVFYIYACFNRKFSLSYTFQFPPKYRSYLHMVGSHKLWHNLPVPYRRPENGLCPGEVAQSQFYPFLPGWGFSGGPRLHYSVRPLPVLLPGPRCRHLINTLWAYVERNNRQTVWHDFPLKQAAEPPAVVIVPLAHVSPLHPWFRTDQPQLFLSHPIPLHQGISFFSLDLWRGKEWDERCKHVI